MLAQFHFQQPLWLLMLIPLAFIWWFVMQNRSGNARAWEKVIDANLLPLLLGGSKDEQKNTKSFAKWLLAITWFLASIALADPVWEKISRPIFQTNSARVIVLDLSSSMLIADLKPSRLARARFKIEDILSHDFSKKEEGQVGLVLFAGDAFVASPLTRDTETIRSLLEVLKPTIMPSQGSRADLGIKKAQALLLQAGVEKGEILLIADGVSDQNATIDAAKMLKKSGHRLSVLAIGTEAGGILPNLTMQNGNRITVKLESKNLKEIAQVGGGNYHLISTNNADLKSVLSKPFNPNKSLEKNEDKESEEWKSTGPFLVLLLLPLAALAFRRGWLFSFFVTASLIGALQTKPVLAAEVSSPQEETKLKPINNFWNSLWQNNEQRAEKALEEKEYNRVDILSDNPLMQGAAKYKSKNYKGALERFKQSKGADARYNEGNALANIKQYKEAIEAYDKALKQQPKMEDALKNKAAVKKLLEQQKHKKQGDNKNKQSQDKNTKKNSKQDNKSEKQGDKKDKSGKEGKDKSKESKNQFSDANKSLDKKSDKNEQKSSEKKGDDKTKKTEKEQAEKKQSKEKKEEEKAPKKGEKKNNNNTDSKESSKKEGTKSEAKELSEEEKMAAEQWLRRIPDDPGGLLRRKFERIYQQQRRKRAINNNEQPW